MRRPLVLLAIVLVLFVATLGVWGALIEVERPRGLRVHFLNVGQGDAILVESPSRKKMLIDGGRDRAVLRELSAVLPWWERTIDVVLATHPDADHVGGLFEVLKRYKVHLILQSGVQHDTPQVESLMAMIAREKSNGAQEVLARRGQVVDLGGGVLVEILFPDRDVSSLETNTASIVARVVYGDTAFMLTGDAPQRIEEYLVLLDGERLDADVLKAGHHGSNTSSALAFVGYVSPRWGVFSRGCENSYGHPHQEVVTLFERFSIETRDTCLDGRVTFTSDGRTVVVEE